MRLQDLLAFSSPQLSDWVKQQGWPAFRARQLEHWIYERGAQDFSEMTNLSRSMRAQLASTARLGRLQERERQLSADGTEKRLYALEDGRLIESVLMPYQTQRRTACISSQAGCAMRCSFCATGQMGFDRHLDAGEIVEQAWRFASELRLREERLSNVVFMGMGEPLHNYDAVIEALFRLRAELGIGARHMTISTVGIPEGIRKLAREDIQVTLAVSLHAAQDPLRSELVPVNRKYPLRELMDACREYASITGRRLTFEWALIAGQNDSRAQALELATLLRGVHAHVNLIPLNPTSGYARSPSDEAAVGEFVETLRGRGITATVRVRRGLDISAGCGQLKSEHQHRQRSALEHTEKG